MCPVNAEGVKDLKTIFLCFNSTYNTEYILLSLLESAQSYMFI